VRNNSTLGLEYFRTNRRIIGSAVFWRALREPHCQSFSGWFQSLRSQRMLSSKSTIPRSSDRRIAAAETTSSRSIARKATAISLLVVIGAREEGQKVMLAVKNMGGEAGGRQSRSCGSSGRAMKAFVLWPPQR
jgi:hypothetical protein